MNLDELEIDRRIEPDQLDVECIQQADLFFKYSLRAIEAKKEVERQEFELDTYEAKLQMQCRRSPGDFGLDNVTESGVKSAVKCHDKFHKRAMALIDAKEEMAVLQAAVTTMDMKKRMLESLITLHGQQYFAGPAIPRNIADNWNNAKKRNSETVLKLQKKNLRTKNKN